MYNILKKTGSGIWACMKPDGIGKPGVYIQGPDIPGPYMMDVNLKQLYNHEY
jgi:hypothetical protein